MKVVGYVRVSSDDQAKDGVSIDVQAEKVRMYASLHNLEMLEVIADAGESAKSLDRPGLARALAQLDDGSIAGVVVYKLDRLTRELGDWTGLIDRYFGERGGRSLMSVSESIDTRTAAGRMVLNIMMTVAQWERETVCERTRTAVRFKQGRGERVSGRIPFGFRLAPDGRTLTPDPDEAAVLADVRAWHAEGRPSRWIAAELDRRGVPTKTGRPWAHTTIQALV